MYLFSPIFYRLVYMAIIATAIGIAILAIGKYLAKNLHQNGYQDYGF